MLPQQASKILQHFTYAITVGCWRGSFYTSAAWKAQQHERLSEEITLGRSWNFNIRSSTIRIPRGRGACCRGKTACSLISSFQSCRRAFCWMQCAPNSLQPRKCRKVCTLKVTGLSDSRCPAVANLPASRQNRGQDVFKGYRVCFHLNAQQGFQDQLMSFCSLSCDTTYFCASDDS